MLFVVRKFCFGCFGTLICGHGVCLGLGWYFALSSSSARQEMLRHKTVPNWTVELYVLTPNSDHVLCSVFLYLANMSYSDEIANGCFNGDCFGLMQRQLLGCQMQCIPC